MCYSVMVKNDLNYLAQKYGAVVIRDQIDDYLRASAMDPKKFPATNARIYPGYYAPIIHMQQGKRVLELMRYGAYPPAQIKNPSAYTTFNARRDNLQSPFWAMAFKQHHGFIVLERFYEWVHVSDLLKAGVVTVDQVKAEFERQSEERRQKILVAGKKYKPTPTELKDPRFRQIVIEFAPQDGELLLAPVIFSYSQSDDGLAGRCDGGFAIVTDDPPAEVEQAGHDRCPVILSESALDNWLDAKHHTAAEHLDLLVAHRRVVFTHKVADAA